MFDREIKFQINFGKVLYLWGRDPKERINVHKHKTCPLQRIEIKIN